MGMPHRDYSVSVGSDPDTETDGVMSPEHAVRLWGRSNTKSGRSSCLSSRANSNLTLTDTEHENTENGRAPPDMWLWFGCGHVTDYCVCFLKRGLACRGVGCMSRLRQWKHTHATCSILHSARLKQWACVLGAGGVLGVLNTGLGKPQEPSPAAFSARLGTQFQPERTKRDRFCSVFLSFLFFPPKISKI